MTYAASETHIDERTVPMYSGPRILAIVNPGMRERPKLKRDNEE